MFENISRIRHERERERKTTAFEFVSQIKFWNWKLLLLFEFKCIKIYAKHFRYCNIFATIFQNISNTYSNRK